MKTASSVTIKPFTIAGSAPNSDPTASFIPWFLLTTRRGLRALKARKTFKLLNVSFWNCSSLPVPS